MCPGLFFFDYARLKVNLKYVVDTSQFARALHFAYQMYQSVSF